MIGRLSRPLISSGEPRRRRLAPGPPYCLAGVAIRTVQSVGKIVEVGDLAIVGWSPGGQVRPYLGSGFGSGPLPGFWGSYAANEDLPRPSIVDDEVGRAPVDGGLR